MQPLSCVALLTLLLVADRVVAAQETQRQDTQRWKWLHANELRTPFTTIRIGAAILPEIAGYNQDDGSREQLATLSGDTALGPVDLRSASRVGLLQTTAAAVSTSPPGTLPTLSKIRDSRFIVSGRLGTKRSVTWQTGLMYDLYAEKWFIRQTGFVVAVPEIHSNFWIGRTKEGPSLNRVMVGYDGWSIERFSFSDAAIPLLADGVRWQGYLPKAHLIWNLGYFLDALSKGESFSYFDHQVAGRVGFVTMQSDTAGSLFHVALGFHNGTPANGVLQLKAKPETHPAPKFVDTGKFPASAAQLLGLELYYRPGP